VRVFWYFARAGSVAAKLFCKWHEEFEIYTPLSLIRIVDARKDYVAIQIAPHLAHSLVCNVRPSSYVCTVIHVLVGTVLL